MMSSRLETPTHTTGAHRALRRAPRTLAQRPPARYEPYLDGLFTYCLSVLCDHDAATEVLGDVLAVSERQFGRCPAADPERRAWLYALARWACLRELGEQRRRRAQQGRGAHAARPTPSVPPPAPAPSAPVPPPAGDTVRAPSGITEHRLRELAVLAWPEAAGTTPEQREALELAVRHQLAAPQVAAVLGMEPSAARELLSAAACEVERTRAALAVVESGTCPAVARLTGDHELLLSATLRRELVRHVDDCPRCRRAAERAGAGGPWPGSSVTPAKLPLVEAPRAAAYMAMLHVPRARAAGPRFGRDGFPLDPRDHAARRDRLRARAVTTTVVATVVAAPVFALWAAYRGAPLTGEGRDGTAVSAAEAGDRAPDEGGPDGRPDHYQNAGSARSDRGGRSALPGPSHLSVEVISPGTPPPAAPGARGPGRVTVTAQPSGRDTTVLTLTASGGAPVSWSLWTNGPWLYADRASGTLAPGHSVTVHVTVDHAREPAGAWTARVGVDPAGAVVEIDGHGARRPPSYPRPGTHTAPPAMPATRPATSPPPSPDPTPTPTPPPTQSAPPSTPPPSPDPAPSDTPPPATGDPAPEPPPA
ncbi:BACON domain-containing protein [Streptomyces lavendulocolor]|uniref:BACON domain-containing protein n=1 Tax=Streptomyces lavendulocolor TaxID=67316 RepID=UPI003CD05C38